MKAKYSHVCPACRFLGTFDSGDLYYCDETVLLRQSDEDSDYISCYVRYVRYLSTDNELRNAYESTQLIL